MCRMSYFMIAGVFTAGALSPSCERAGQPSVRDEKVEEMAEENTRPPLRFRTVSYVDRQGIGIKAFTMVIPSDWSFEGGIRWALDNPGMPAVAAFSIRNPAGTEVLEVFPNQAFFWTTSELTLQIQPIGSRYFGAEVRPPLGPIAALKSIVLGRFREGIPDLRIVREQQLPELASSLGAGRGQAGVSAGADAASIRIEYLAGGGAVEEELYAVVEAFSFPIQSMFGTQTNTFWTVDYIFSFRCEKGKLDEQKELFRTIVSSFRLNPQWFSKYNQVVEYLIAQQIQRIRNIGELSRIISRTHNEISDMMMETYNNRQQVYDRLSENFSQYLRGVDEYYDPVEQRRVELPSGYNEGWVNGLGEYILSDNPNYNPNIGSNQTWHRMEKK